MNWLRREPLEERRDMTELEFYMGASWERGSGMGWVVWEVGDQ